MNENNGDVRRIAIFGGSFNPIHNGHLNSALSVGKKLAVDEVRIVPSFQSPGREYIESPTPEERFEMAKLATADYPEILKVDDREIRRKGISYTVDTVASFRKEYPEAEIFLVVGADIFQSFSQWKDWQTILETCNLVVTSRPGSRIPFRLEELPEEIAPLVESITIQGALLKSGNHIAFVQLDDQDVSSTEIRKCMRTGLHVDRYIPISVEKYLRENKFYQTGGVKISDYGEFTRFCSNILNSKKGVNLRAFDLRKINYPSEYSIIVSGTSRKHTVALAEAVVEEVKKEYGVSPQSLEGKTEGRWVLLDFGALIIHVFYDFVRAEYSLEELFAGGKPMVIEESA